MRTKDIIALTVYWYALGVFYCGSQTVIVASEQPRAEQAGSMPISFMKNENRRQGRGALKHFLHQSYTGELLFLSRATNIYFRKS
jgi:hypothetical protein